MYKALEAGEDKFLNGYGSLEEHIAVALPELCKHNFTLVYGQTKKEHDLLFSVFLSPSAFLGLAFVLAYSASNACIASAEMKSEGSSMCISCRGTNKSHGWNPRDVQVL